LGDQLIDAGVAGIYNNPKRKVDSKGVAFPTCISVNNCVGHFSPLKDDTTVLKDGDLVKMYACPLPVRFLLLFWTSSSACAFPPC